MEYIKKHQSLEKFLKSADAVKFNFPSDWPHQQAKQLFLKPDVLDPEKVDVR